MRIILVEDDHKQASFFSERLAGEFGGPVQMIRNELEFQRRFRELEGDPPELFVIDVLLDWTVAEPGMTLPPKGCQNRNEAGLRCQRLLANSAATRGVPVILWSYAYPPDSAALNDLPPTASFLVKDSYDLRPLFQEVRRLTGSQPGSAGSGPAAVRS